MKIERLLQRGVGGTDGGHAGSIATLPNWKKKKKRERNDRHLSKLSVYLFGNGFTSRRWIIQRRTASQKNPKESKNDIKESLSVPDNRTVPAIKCRCYFYS